MQLHPLAYAREAERLSVIARKVAADGDHKRAKYLRRLAAELSGRAMQ